MNDNKWTVDVSYDADNFDVLATSGEQKTVYVTIKNPVIFNPTDLEKLSGVVKQIKSLVEAVVSDRPDNPHYQPPQVKDVVTKETYLPFDMPRFYWWTDWERWTKAKLSEKEIGDLNVFLPQNTYYDWTFVDKAVQYLCQDDISLDHSNFSQRFIVWGYSQRPVWNKEHKIWTHLENEPPPMWVQNTALRQPVIMLESRPQAVSVSIRYLLPERNKATRSMVFESWISAKTKQTVCVTNNEFNAITGQVEQKKHGKKLSTLTLSLYSQYELWAVVSYLTKVYGEECVKNIIAHDPLAPEVNIFERFDEDGY